MTTGDLLAMITEIAAGAEPLAERATRISGAIRDAGHHRWVGSTR
jgi:hypothetical protein